MAGNETVKMQRNSMSHLYYILQEEFI